MREFEEKGSPIADRFRPVADTISHSERAYQLILTKLLDRTFVARQTIDIDALVGELFVSRQPIRDALNRLAAEGLVVVVPQVGCVVAAPSDRDVADAINLLRSCETKVASLAAVRRSGSDVRHLRAILHQTERLLERGDVTAIEMSDRYRELNRSFHRILLDAIGSPSLSAFAQALEHRVEFMLLGPISRTAAPPPSDSLDARRAVLAATVARIRERNDEHAAVAAAVEAGDGPAAARAMEEHLAHGFRTLGIARLR